MIVNLEKEKILCNQIRECYDDSKQYKKMKKNNEF